MGNRMRANGCGRARGRGRAGVRTGRARRQAWRLSSASAAAVDVGTCVGPLPLIPGALEAGRPRVTWNASRPPVRPKRSTPFAPRARTRSSPDLVPVTVISVKTAARRKCEPLCWSGGTCEQERYAAAPVCVMREVGEQLRSLRQVWSAK